MCGLPDNAPQGAAGVFLPCNWGDAELRFVPDARQGRQGGIASRFRSAVEATAADVHPEWSGEGLIAPLPTKDLIASVSIDQSGMVTVDFTPGILGPGPLISLSWAEMLINTIASNILVQPEASAVRFTVSGDCQPFWHTIGASSCFTIDRTGRHPTDIGTGAPTPENPVATPAAPVTSSSTYWDFWPTSYNGRKVFLSVACHDPDLGPDCVDNYYCGWSENSGSKDISFEATLGTQHGVSGYNNLLERGYAVRIGDGGVNNNISWSNAWTSYWRTAVHIPVHTNGVGSGSCPEQPSESAAGTRIFYESSNGSDAANEYLYTIRYASPGDNDKKQYTQLAETDPVGVEAVPIYTESEFHTWTTGANWLWTYPGWAWRIGWATDRCFGYPRLIQDPYSEYVKLTGTKRCAWASG